MKRTITEILIEIEETVAVRQTEKTLVADTATINNGGETNICPFCGQSVSTAEKLQKENDENEKGNNK